MIPVQFATAQASAATYAGDITPTEAWAMLCEDERAILVDVRTHAEWVFVGLPDLSGMGRRLVTAAWQHYPQMARNPAFLDELRAAGIGAADPVILLCRSGVRSKSAAEYLTQNGFTACYNVAGGFEGQLDAAKHRGVGGWRAAGLPWTQS
jgi:rhodanese-related sulfurtransferase